ncbi:hypothetical protein DFJ63DRAFT_316509 [Scheffersomyces coipomensis]|uniref:uncharacterized protein n=1 Tax=Scheffersomyces coipomensis TaxID=1788519 RepID=UPI00315CD617
MVIDADRVIGKLPWVKEKKYLKYYSRYYTYNNPKDVELEDKANNENDNNYTDYNDTNNSDCQDSDDDDNNDDNNAYTSNDDDSDDDNQDVELNDAELKELQNLFYERRFYDSLSANAWNKMQEGIKDVPDFLKNQYFVDAARANVSGFDLAVSLEGVNLSRRELRTQFQKHLDQAFHKPKKEFLEIMDEIEKLDNSHEDIKNVYRYLSAQFVDSEQTLNYSYSDFEIAINNLDKLTRMKLIKFLQLARVLVAEDLYWIIISFSLEIHFCVMASVGTKYSFILKLLAKLAPEKYPYEPFPRMHNYFITMFNDLTPFIAEYEDGSKKRVDYKILSILSGPIVLLEYTLPWNEAQSAGKTLNDFFYPKQSRKAWKLTQEEKEQYDFFLDGNCTREALPSGNPFYILDKGQGSNQRKGKKPCLYRVINRTEAPKVYVTTTNATTKIYFLVELLFHVVPAASRSIHKFHQVKVLSSLSFCSYCHTTRHIRYTCEVAPCSICQSKTHIAPKHKASVIDDKDKGKIHGYRKRRFKPEDYINNSSD